MFTLLIGVFLGGVVVGAIIQINGYLRQISVGLPENFNNQNQVTGQDQGSGRTRIILSDEDSGQSRVYTPGDNDNDPKCVLQMNNFI